MKCIHCHQEIEVAFLPGPRHAYCDWEGLAKRYRAALQRIARMSKIGSGTEIKIAVEVAEDALNPVKSEVAG